jgi:hypothetical protein
MEFEHSARKLENKRRLVYTAVTKHFSYFKDHINKFVIEEGYAPISPWGVPYFLLDTVERDALRETNNTYVIKADEVWVFGPISDGVLAEILLAKETNKKTRYFRIEKSRHIKEIGKEEAEFEDEVKQYKGKI